MAHSEHLKKMFRAFRKGDSALFMEAAGAVIKEERRRLHEVLADELRGSLQNGDRGPPTTAGWARYRLSPRGPERGGSLFEVRRPERYLRELELNDVQRRMTGCRLRFQA